MIISGIIDKSISAIADTLKSVRSVYSEKRAEVDKLNREITEINQAPRTRAELERALCTAVNRYVDQRGKPLVDWCQRFRQVNPTNEEDANYVVSSLSDAFLGRNGFDASKSGIEELLRTALLDGAKRLAATVDWPDGALDPATRAQRLAEIEPRRDQLADELTEIHDRAQRTGIRI